jgi:hypothetical protein
MKEQDVVRRLHEKIRVCDAAVKHLPPGDDIDRPQIERAIREVRADAVDRLRAFGVNVGGKAA